MIKGLLYFILMAGNHDVNVSNLTQDYESKYLVGNCFSKFDTVFTNGDYIRYQSINDSFFNVEIKINDKAQELKYIFDCQVPRGIVPSLFTHSDDLILLKRGFGNNYREIVTCLYLGDSIYVCEFETTRNEFATADIYVFQLISDTENLFIADHEFVNGEHGKINIKKVKLGKEYQNETLFKSTIYSSEIEVQFISGKKCYIPI